MDSVINKISAEEIYNNIQKKVNSKMIKNPKFKELLIKEVNYIYYKTNNKEISVEVNEQIPIVSLKSNHSIIDCRRELVDKNQSFIESVFYLYDEDLVLEFSQGIIFSRIDLENIGLRTSIYYETKLETNYIQKVVNKDGIEYSYSSYNDSYPLKTLFDNINLEEVVTSSFYRPIFNTYHLPESPIHVGAASVRNTYRKLNELHLIHSNIGELSKEGYQNVTAMLASTHLDRPELMRADLIFARANGTKNEDLKLKVIDYSLGSNLTEINDKVKELFKNGLESSFTKKEEPDIVESLLSYI